LNTEIRIRPTYTFSEVYSRRVLQTTLDIVTESWIKLKLLRCIFCEFYLFATADYHSIAVMS